MDGCCDVEREGCDDGLPRNKLPVNERLESGKMSLPPRTRARLMRLASSAWSKHRNSLGISQICVQDNYLFFKSMIVLDTKNWKTNGSKNMFVPGMSVGCGSEGAVALPLPVSSLASRIGPLPRLRRVSLISIRNSRTTRKQTQQQRHVH